MQEGVGGRRPSPLVEGSLQLQCFPDCPDLQRCAARPTFGNPLAPAFRDRQLGHGKRTLVSIFCQNVLTGNLDSNIYVHTLSALQFKLLCSPMSVPFISCDTSLTPGEKEKGEAPLRRRGKSSKQHCRCPELPPRTFGPDLAG